MIKNGKGIEQSMDNGSGNRTHDRWTTRPGIKPLHHEDKIALSMKFCGFYSACARRENIGFIMNWKVEVYFDSIYY